MVSVAVATGLFFAFAVAKVMQAQRRPAVTGAEGLAGEEAQVRRRLNPTGSVFLKGELWDATAIDGPIESGESVEVVEVEGFHLRVRRAAESQPGLGLSRI